MEDMGNDPTARRRPAGTPRSARRRPTRRRRATSTPSGTTPSCTSTRSSTRRVRRQRRAAHAADRRPGSGPTTPNFSVISPNLCHDGHDAPCANGEPGGLSSIDAWLREWVPVITGCPAFKQDGLLLITFDEAENGDATRLLRREPVPNTPNNGGPPPGWAAAASAQSRSRRSSGRAPSARPPTTTTRRCAPSRASSRCPTSATPPRRTPGSSRRTSSPPAERRQSRRVWRQGPGITSRSRFTTQTMIVAQTSAQKPWMSKPRRSRRSGAASASRRRTRSAAA